MAGNFFFCNPKESAEPRIDVCKLKTAKERICFMHKHMLYTDVHLLANGRDNMHEPPIIAHKAILSIGSPVFANMFINSNEYEIKIPNVEGNILRKVIEFLYTDTVHLENGIEVIQTFVAADEFQMPYLKEICEDLMSTIQLSINTACQILKLSASLNITVITRRAKEFIEFNAVGIFMTSAFLGADMKTIKTILKLQNLNVKSEKVIFDAMMAWASNQSPDFARKKQWSEVRMHVDTLLRHIRFLSMSTAEFAECISCFYGLFTERESLDIMMHIAKPGESNLPPWCNKSTVKRGIGQPTVSQPRTEKVLNITLRLTEPRYQDSLPLNFVSIVEIDCLRDSYMLLGAKLKWMSRNPDACSFSTLNYTLRVSIASSGFEYNEPVRKICEQYDATVEFPEVIIVKQNEILRIEALVNYIRGFGFYTYENSLDANQSNVQLLCTRDCIPKHMKFSVFSSLSFQRVANHSSRRNRRKK